MPDMLDSVTAPAPWQVQEAQRSGVVAWPGYIGGPEVYEPAVDPAKGGWCAPSFEVVRAGGLVCPGIYVGIGSSEEAITLARERGCTKVEHDLETVAAMAALTPAVADGFVADLHKAGLVAGLYGTLGFAGAFGRHYDTVWVAGGPWYRRGSSTPPTDPRQSGVNVIGKPMGWQWWATHTEFGISVDRSVIDEEFVMAAWDLDMKRLAILDLRHHFEDWPSSVASVDSYAEQIADDGSNLLAVRDAAMRQFLADGWVSLYSRIGALEAAVASLKNIAGVPQAVLDEVAKIEAQMAAIAKAAGQ